jgi:hypothetical protein
MLITVVVYCKECTVFSYLNKNTLVSNDNLGIYVHVSSLFVLSSVGRGLAIGQSFIQEDLPIIIKIHISRNF